MAKANIGKLLLTGVVGGAIALEEAQFIKALQTN